MRCLVDVCTELVSQASYHIQVAVLDRDVQGCASFVRCLDDVGSEFLDKASHHSEIPLLRCDILWSSSIVCCLVDVRAELLHQQATIARWPFWAAIYKGVAPLCSP
jgi:hypothetical protein